MNACTNLHCMLSRTYPHWSNELISQITPCVKIFISYMTMSAPRVKGVNFSTIIEFVGRFPSNTLWGRMRAIWSAGMLDFCSSASTTSFVLPFIRASVCAKKLASSNYHKKKMLSVTLHYTMQSINLEKTVRITSHSGIPRVSSMKRLSEEARIKSQI